MSGIAKAPLRQQPFPRGAPGRKAIVCSSQHWTAPVQLSAHHLAKFLIGRDWRVAFLSTPTSLLHRLRFAGDAATRDRWRNWRNAGSFDQDGRLFHYTPFALLPPSRLPGLNIAWLLHNWPRLAWPRVPNVLARAGFATPDLMILDTALMLPLWQALGGPRLIYRVTDLNREFPGQPAELTRMEAATARAADLVIYTGDTLANYTRSLGPRDSLCLPHGVDLAHFSTPAAEPPEYATIPRPRAVYVGMIAQWFDTELLLGAARRLPELSFVVVGPQVAATAAAPRLPNLHWLGARPYAAVPGYLQHADVGLIPFGGARLEAYVDAINPLKLYEYMAAGLPVVATPFRQIADLDSPAVLAEGPDAFAAAIRRLLMSPGDGRRERAFAREREWSRQFMPLVARLGL